MLGMDNCAYMQSLYFININYGNLISLDFKMFSLIHLSDSNIVYTSKKCYILSSSYIIRNINNILMNCTYIIIIINCKCKMCNYINKSIQFH